MALPYPVILTASLVFVAVVYALGREGIYALPWLMFFTATTSSVHGLWAGLGAALLSIGALSFFRNSQPDYGVMIVILLLSAYLADQVGQSLRQARQKAKQLAQLQDVFLQGLEAVPQFHHREQLLRQLPTLLAQMLQSSHLHIWIPSGMGQLTLLQESDSFQGGGPKRAPSEAVPSALVHRSLQEERMVCSQNELAVPLQMHQETVAVLQFLRDKDWQPAELELFSRLAQAVGRQLEHLHDLELRRHLLKAADQLARATDKSQVAAIALEHLLPALDMEMGAVMQHRCGRMQGLSWKIPGELESELVPLAQSFSCSHGLIWQAYRLGTAQFAENYQDLPEAVPELKALGFESLVAYPIYIRDAMRGRVVLVLGSRSRVAWTRSKKEILLGMERLLSSALERVLLDELHQRINRLLTEAWSYPSQQVYQDILEAAIELVPGSEAGSLWVREGQGFVCKAAAGSIWACDERWSEARFQAWYASGETMASRGQPRILNRNPLGGAGASLCLPVSHQGKVLAYLNLDSLHDPGAFEEDSLAAAELFATPIATLVHEIQNRIDLERAALTDGLTGLYNRRAFDRRLKEECERAARYQYPLTLLVLDLKNFKPINDRLGHAMGDQALVMVARALSKTHRSSDLVFRWGGDEFAVLLPQTSKEAAAVVSGRILEAISRICIGGICLSANIGFASFPDEAESTEALLQMADQRMYEDKDKSRAQNQGAASASTHEASL